MPTTDRYVPKHRAVKHAALRDWKRITALGATLPAAFATVGTVTVPAEAATKREQNIHEAIGVARDQKGDEYEYGADGPEQFDCSGLMQFAFEKAGINMPRTSDAQASKGDRIPRRQLQPGDLIAFHDGGDVYHVALYTGRTDSGKHRIIEAANEGTDVRSAPVWDNSWYGVTLRNNN